jgi:CENP-B N-terminal DNA-binding domain
MRIAGSGMTRAVLCDRLSNLGLMPTLHDYIQRKRRELSDTEKQAIRLEIERGNADVYRLAKQFNCVPTQVAGIKARMKS